jgi:hypothetical protein
MGIAIYIAHLRGLRSPVGRVILDDAERVYPEVLQAQLMSDDDAILECFRQATPFHDFLQC